MADSTYDNAPEPGGRWWALAAGLFAAAAGIFTFLVSRPRRETAAETRIISPALSLTETPVEPAIPQVPTPQTPPSAGRTLAFMIVTVVLAVVFIVLQNSDSELSAPLFLGVVLGAVMLAIASAPPRARAIIFRPARAAQLAYHTLTDRLFIPYQLFVRNRRLIAALSTLLALVCMLLSSIAFQMIREEEQPLIWAVNLMLYGIMAVGFALFCARPNIPIPTFTTIRSVSVTYRPNFLLTGLGISTMYFLSEINGKMLDVSRLYPITTDTQFWILVLGISLTVMGLSGWTPVFRLPAIRWRLLALAVALLVGSMLLTEILSRSPLDTWFITPPLHTILFWTVRAGDILIVWAVLSGTIKIQLPAIRDKNLFALAAVLVYMILLAQDGLRTEVSQWLGTAAQNPFFWLILIGLLVGVWRLCRLKGLNWRWAVIGLGSIVGLYFIAVLSETITLDIGFWLAINPLFWMILAGINFLRLVAFALYRRLAAPTVMETDVISTDAAAIETTADDLTEHKPYSFFANTLHYGLLVGIIMLAFFARFYLLNDTMRFLVDEDSYIDAVYYLEVNTDTEILAPFSGIAAFPYIFPFFESKTIDFFGPTFLGLRAASAIIGALTIPALYLLARMLFDRQTALLAALFLATFPPHLQFSRIGINEMSGPLVATLAFAFLGRGLLRNRPSYYAIGGIFLGLTHYFDEGSRLLFAPVMLAWMIGLVVVWRRSGRGKHILLAVVAALIVAIPIYYTLIGLNRPLAGRMVDNQSGLNGDYWRELFESGDYKDHIDAHLIAAFLVYTTHLDQTLFYAGDTAMLLWYMIPLVLLGLAYASWRWRAPGMALLLIWIISVSLGNSLLTSSMSYPRFVLMFPALMLAAAVGVRYLVPLLLQNVRAAALVALAVTVIVAGGQMVYYFNDYLPLYNVQFRASKASPDGYDAALRSVDFPIGTTIHIISLSPVNQIEAAGLLHLSRPDLVLETLSREDFTDDYIDDLRCRVDHAFFIERTDFETLAKLRENFYLRAPEFTPYDDFLPGQRLILFYAPYIKGSEDVYGRKC